MIVVDASVLASALADDGADGDRARYRLSGDPDLHAPYLIDVEIASTLREGRRRGTIDERRATEALDDLAELDLVRYPHVPFLKRVWELRDNVTPSDAIYVGLAEALDATLVTADASLARAPGTRCPLELLE